MLQGLLFLAPFLALLAVLLARRYPGERVLQSLRRRPRARRLRSCPRALQCGRLVVETVRGGLLIGRSLAVRPPPLAL
ncbi:MAG TPA: hypothetical protein VMG62_00505 [Solirubrobacteraceae bacterium]|nr:hypothetical protein [Solirubrobacteraceae bacterium]